MALCKEGVVALAKTGTGKVFFDRNYEVGEVDKRIYSSFIEHMERVVYEGIYEPGHPLADDDGFRTDIIDLVREMQIPLIRYPGGNFLSGYNWEDGIGPVDKRPVRLDLAWIAEETNKVGTDEFIRWAKKADTEVNMAVNLGTRDADAARNLVEYCNYPSGTYWSDLRIKNGAKEPYAIKTWCLGNEMDGHWQIGRKTATEYGRIALEAGKLMKLVDKRIELVLCGSSNAKMQTYPAWDMEVLETAYDVADYISLHNYFSIVGTTIKDFLAYGVEMQEQIRTIIAVCDCAKAKTRSKKTVNLSYDEWGIWNVEERENRNKWTFDWDMKNAISEGSYSFADALLTGSIMMTLLNNCDRVSIACQAQLVNHLSLINCAKGGRSWKQTIFYPFKHTSVYGRGTALRPVVESPTYGTEAWGQVPVLETAAVINEEKREFTIFILNRDTESAVETNFVLRGFEKLTPTEHIVYTNDDLMAVNSLDAPENIVPHTVKAPAMEGENMSVTLQSGSWNVIRMEF